MFKKKGTALFFEKVQPMETAEKERIYAELARVGQINHKLSAENKEIRQKSLVKIIAIFGAVIFFGVSTQLRIPLNFEVLSLYMLFFALFAGGLFLDMFYEAGKRRENAENLLKLDSQNEDIVELKNKCNELEQKYNELLNKSPN